MKISVLIDNYNYGKYIKDAIESVLKQSYKNFELIIVDDGSTDNSKEIIQKYAKKDKRIKVIFKKNGGQAAALNDGIRVCSGEVISFLDSDDRFKSNKLEQVVKAYKKGYHYIVNNFHLLGNKEYNNAPFAPYGGYNKFLVYYLNTFIGGTTSCISISKKLADIIFPIKYEEKFRIRADDYIVFWASFLEEEYFLHEPLTDYRIHGENLFATSVITYSKRYDRDVLMYKIRKDILDYVDSDKYFFKNAYNLYLEFTTKHIIDLHILKVYLKVLFIEMDCPLLKKIYIAYKKIVFYLVNRKSIKFDKKPHF